MQNGDNKLFIKNMVCPRCIKVVKDELNKLNVKVRSVVLGEVESELPKERLPMEKIKKMLLENGFELIDDKNSKIIEKVKNEIISVLNEYEGEEITNINFPNFLTKKINKDYNSISSIFSKTEGITIEHYIILQKIEKVKEFLKYNELTLSQIA